VPGVRVEDTLLVNVEELHTISLMVDVMYLRIGESLTIYDGASETARQLDILTGVSKPTQLISSTGASLYIKRNGGAASAGAPWAFSMRIGCLCPKGTDQHRCTHFPGSQLLGHEHMEWSEQMESWLPSVYQSRVWAPCYSSFRGDCTRSDCTRAGLPIARAAQVICIDSSGFIGDTGDHAAVAPALPTRRASFSAAAADQTPPTSTTTATVTTTRLWSALTPWAIPSAVSPNRVGTQWCAKHTSALLCHASRCGLC
jgi:hypothetical protein